MSQLTYTSPRRKRLFLLSLLPLVAIGGAVVAGLALQTRPGARAAAGNLPPTLLSHFSFGVVDAPGGTSYLNGMRSTNGTAWDFRYQYLAGGVNTGNGWERWNMPAGQFATYYLQESGSNGYLPAFVYYEMLQSNGSCGGCGEAQRDLSNLNNASTMAAYYANWTLLMRKIAAYGKPTLVIVEPDLWGFIEKVATGHGNSAVGIPASVASSGNADAAGLPNTAQGFAWAMLRTRDRYARNAVLALHASAWGTGIDIASNTDASLDAAAVGAQQARFLLTAGLAENPGGLSTFDLISNDVADHDSGQSGIWWDRYDKTFPNFARYLQYANALSTGTGRRIMMWQVPEGNQYFDTQNNSQGHTQDNRPEYILSHVANFANAGIIGVLFGPGNGGTSINDGRGDGVTNPTPISKYECNFCNSHTSSYPDDDGGYLRIFVGQYYRAGGYPLGGTTPTPTPPSAGGSPTPMQSLTPTQSPTPGPCAPRVTFGASSAVPASAASGGSVAFATTFTASCVTSGLVDFEVYSSGGQKVWQTWQNNQALTARAQSFEASWTVPTGLGSGTYYLKIGVFSAGWGRLYGWDNSAATLTIGSAATPIQNAPCTVTINGAQRTGTCSGTITSSGG
jgi:hypothetical protein